MVNKLVFIGIPILFISMFVKSQDIAELPYYKHDDWSMWLPMVKKEAVYPKKSVKKKIEGCVNVYFSITSRGKIGEAKIVKSVPEGMFDEYALDALSAWRYDPSKENPERRPILTNAIYTFALEGNKSGKSREEWIEICRNI